LDDRLEKFIKDNREEMDFKSPRNDLWGDIENQLKDNSKQIKLSKTVVYWRAAAVILLLITSWLVIDKFTTESNGIADVETVVFNPELEEAETFYITLINEKRGEISALSKKYELGKDFLNEIDRLDLMYSELKQELNGGDEDNLVDAMIRNLQLRIEILNQQLKIIQSIEKSQKDEAINL